MENLIEKTFGKDTLLYLQNKSRGGENNQKGNAYEQFFAVYKICELSSKVIEGKEKIILTSQAKLQFVDDFVVVANDNKYEHYQLRDTKNIAWLSLKNSLAENFTNQLSINEKCGYNTTLYLVVSDSDIKDNLESEKPQNIKEQANVILFPARKTLIQVVLEDKKFLEAVGYLCTDAERSPDKIDCVAKIILGAWASSNQTDVSLKALLADAKKMGNPSYIRALNDFSPIPEAIKKILNSVQDFSYKIEKGLFYWAYKDDLYTGTLTYTCDNKDFEKFLNQIAVRKPTNFEELEVLL